MVFANGLLITWLMIFLPKALFSYSGYFSLSGIISLILNDLLLFLGLFMKQSITMA